MSRDEAINFLGISALSPQGVEDAVSAFEKGLFRHGFAVLNMILQQDPKAVKAWEEKARHLRALRLNEAAARCYRRALSLEEDPLLDIALACALSDLGRHGEAIDTYDTLVAKTRDPEALAIAHANRGNSHGVLGNVEAATSDFEEAIRREPSRVTHYLNYELLFARRKQWVEASGVLARGLGAVAGVDAVPLLLEKARISNEQEQAELGLAAADEVLLLVPDQPRALYQRGWALGMLGRLDDAQASLQRLLDIEPTNQDAQRALQKIEAVMPPTRGSKPWWKLWS